MDLLGIVVRLSALSIVVVIGWIMSTRGPGLNDVFSWHPILMTLAFLVFMTEGILSYSTVLPGDSARASRRKRHGAMQGLATIFFLMGYLMIFVKHEQTGASHFALGEDESAARVIHVWLGYGLLLASSIQVCVGISKYIRITQASVKIAKWHGKLGRVIYPIALGNICLAIEFFDAFSNEAKVGLIIWIVFVATATIYLLLEFPINGADRPIFQRVPIR